MTEMVATAIEPIKRSATARASDWIRIARKSQEKPAVIVEKTRQNLRVVLPSPHQSVSSEKPNTGLRQKAMVGIALKKV